MTVRSKDKFSCIAGNVMAGFLLVILIVLNAIAICGWNWWELALKDSVAAFVVLIVWHAFAVVASVLTLIFSNVLVTVDENGVTEKFLNRTLHHISWQDVKRLEIVWVNGRYPRLVINVMSVNEESSVSKHNINWESTKKRITFLYRKAVLSEIQKYCDKWIYGWDNTLNYVEEGSIRT